MVTSSSLNNAGAKRKLAQVLALVSQQIYIHRHVKHLNDLYDRCGGLGHTVPEEDRHRAHFSTTQIIQSHKEGLTVDGEEPLTLINRLNNNLSRKTSEDCNVFRFTVLPDDVSLQLGIRVGSYAGWLVKVLATVVSPDQYVVTIQVTSQRDNQDKDLGTKTYTLDNPTSYVRFQG